MRVGNFMKIFEKSHMKPGFNGDAVKYRLDLLASQGHPLWITEFDTSQRDLLERALDTEDFLRMAYSHPDVVGIITWYFMIEDTPFAMNFFDHQTIFEGEVNADSQGQVESHRLIYRGCITTSVARTPVKFLNVQSYSFPTFGT